jgi:hypothetical protein
MAGFGAVGGCSGETTVRRGSVETEAAVVSKEIRAFLNGAAARGIG